MRLSLLCWYVFLIFTICSTFLITPVAYAQSSGKQWVEEPTVASPIAGQKRLALIIGNTHYGGSHELKNPENDARAMAITLGKLGFSSTVLLDASRTRMRDAIHSFTDQIKDSGPSTVALLFYSGHGIQVDGENYLIPIGFVKPAHREDISDYALSAQKAIAEMQKANAQVNIAILDACRDNPFEGSRSLTGSGLAKLEARGMLIAFATEAGKTASDNEDKANGLYTSKLLENLAIPGLTLNDIFKRTQRAVYRASSSGQFPYVYDGLIDDDEFYLLPFRKEPVPDASKKIASKPDSVVTVKPAITLPSNLPTLLIRRPLDGQTVRENVYLLLRRSELKQGSYLSLWVDEINQYSVNIPDTQSPQQKMETENIRADKDTVTLKWDTIPFAEGSHRVDIVLHDRQGTPLNQGHLSLIVSNRGGLMMPANGVPTSYYFVVPSLERFKKTVHLMLRQTTPASQGSTEQPDRINDIPIQDVKAVILRRILSVTNNQAQVREAVMEGYISEAGHEAIPLLQRYDLQPNECSVSESGTTLFKSPSAITTVLIPGIGVGHRRIGETWTARTPMVMEWGVKGTPPIVVAQTRLNALGWLNGYQTAEIEQTYQGKMDLPIVNGSTMPNAMVNLRRRIWLSYKSGAIIRMDTEIDAVGQVPAILLQSLAPRQFSESSSNSSIEVCFHSVSSVVRETKKPQASPATSAKK